MKPTPVKLLPELGLHSVWTLLWRWVLGAAVGTGVIAVTSPLFLRSYLPLNADPCGVSGLSRLIQIIAGVAKGMPIQRLALLECQAKLCRYSGLSVSNGEQTADLNQLKVRRHRLLFGVTLRRRVFLLMMMTSCSQKLKMRPVVI